MMRCRATRSATRVLRASPVLIATLLAGCGAASPEPAPPTPVNVVTVAARPSALPLNYTARSRGEREVEVRARVSGILLRRFFREGAEVAAGDRLFLIDPAPFQADVRSAQGRLSVEQARLQAATLQWRRVGKLFERGFVSGRSRDDAEAEYRAGLAAVETARAELAHARLNLGYTDVRAPISGMTGREVRSEGSLVDSTDDTALLTRITQSDRLHIDFAMPESEARQLRDAIAANPASVGVRIRPAAGEPLPELAHIDFINTRVTPDTGTVEISAALDNRSGRLSAGQFIRAEVVGLTTASGIYVPARAVLFGATGPFVWKVSGKGTSVMQPVKLALATGNLLHVQSGLRPRDKVIIDGVLKLQSDGPVKPVEVPLDAPPALGAAAP